MTDQNSQFFAILTAVGEARQANANALGVPWTFAQMGVGDANLTDPIPSRTQTRLINERRRAPLNQVSVDPKNPSVIIAEQVIPPDEGGWWIREIGLYDAAGDLVAVANCAPSFKPLLSQGTGKTQVVRLNLVVTSSANVQLKIDPAVVLATRQYVDSQILNVLPANKVASRYTMVEVNERGVVQQGYNPTTLTEYGITDAMPFGAGGLMSTVPHISGPLAALHVSQFVAVSPLTTDKPLPIDYGAGFHLKYPDKNYSLELIGGMNSDWFGFRRIDDQGNGAWRTLWHEGNFNPATKAERATTLEGYGITDAMPFGAGGLMSTAPHIAGPLAALHTSQFVAVSPLTTDKPVSIDYGAGFHLKYPDKNYSLELVGGMNADWFGFRRIDDQGNGAWRTLWHEGNFNPATKADKATTLDGYGIAKATDAEAEAGTDNSKAVTPLRVFQAIAKMVRQATESVAGLLRLATQDEVDLGIGADTAVTPAKLRMNFAFHAARVGYIAFPSFLGGLIIQWRNTPVSPTEDVHVSFPIPFPRAVFSVLTTCDYAPGSGALNYHAACLVDNSQFMLRSSPGATAAGFAFAVGC
ncbi:MAG: phage tail protein [Pseudomonas sp.]|uniref:phage tail protein n=1 Tax=Pseudomonas sp. TaxID=306 RepID=UPI003D0A0431